MKRGLGQGLDALFAQTNNVIIPKEEKDEIALKQSSLKLNKGLKCFRIV